MSTNLENYSESDYNDVNELYMSVYGITLDQAWRDGLVTSYEDELNTFLDRLAHQ